MSGRSLFLSLFLLSDQFSQEYLFYKKSAKTGLRVFYNGDLQLYNCHELLQTVVFDPALVAIDGIVDMVYGNNAKKALHRVRQIEGVCEKVHKLR